MGTVTLHEVRFTEDEIRDGDIPHDDEHTRTTMYDGVTARQAADILVRTGLSFAATGNDWAADPDGSYVSDYATGEHTQTTGHLSGFPDRVVSAIITVVG